MNRADERTGGRTDGRDEKPRPRQGRRVDARLRRLPPFGRKAQKMNLEQLVIEYVERDARQLQQGTDLLPAVQHDGDDGADQRALNVLGNRLGIIFPSGGFDGLVGLSGDFLGLDNDGGVAGGRVGALGEEEEDDLGEGWRAGDAGWAGKEGGPRGWKRDEWCLISGVRNHETRGVGGISRAEQRGRRGGERRAAAAPAPDGENIPGRRLGRRSARGPGRAAEPHEKIAAGSRARAPPRPGRETPRRSAAAVGAAGPGPAAAPRARSLSLSSP